MARTAARPRNERKRSAPIVAPAEASAGLDLRPWLLGFAFAELVLFTWFGIVNRDEAAVPPGGAPLFQGQVPT